LPCPIVVDCQSEPGVDLVEVLQAHVQLVSLLFELENLILLGSDVPFQVFDFIIQNELKLLKLLCLLFERIDLLLPLSNLLIFQMNLL
jgi:hypothetical protein